MNKKIVLLLTLAFILLFPAISRAQETASFAPMPPYDGGMPAQPFGQTHAYTVTLRGNAEAVVSMKAVFTNYEEATQSAMTFQVPKGEIKSISAYQVVHEPQCIRYDDQPIIYDKYDQANQTPAGRPMYKEPVCIEYQDPDYYNYYYGNTKYLKADVTMDSGTINISLSKEIGPQKSGSIVLYYRATGFVKKDSFGAYTYSFETLKSDTTIRSLTVGVNTDSDLMLEGTDQSVNYETTKTMAPLLARDSGMKQGSFVSAEFDSYYQQIGYGRITKTSADLQPYDSFTVEGRYAKSRFQLYGKKITIGGLIGLGILLFLVAIIYRGVKALSTKNNSASGAKTQSSTTTTSVLMTFGMSLLSSVFAGIYTIGLYIFFTVLERGYYSQMNMIIMLFAILISCIVYILIIFGPAVFMGWKRGVWWGVGTIGVTVFLLCIYVALFIMYQLVANQSNIYPSIMYRDAAQSTEPVQYMK